VAYAFIVTAATRNRSFDSVVMTQLSDRCPTLSAGAACSPTLLLLCCQLANVVLTVVPLPGISVVRHESGVAGVAPVSLREQ
jgi:hypothetical protein